MSQSKSKWYINVWLKCVGEDMEAAIANPVNLIGLSRHGNLSVPVRELLDWVNWNGNVHPNYGLHQPVD